MMASVMGKKICDSFLFAVFGLFFDRILVSNEPKGHRFFYFIHKKLLLIFYDYSSLFLNIHVHESTFRLIVDCDLD